MGWIRITETGRHRAAGSLQATLVKGIELYCKFEGRWMVAARMKEATFIRDRVDWMG